MPWRIVKEDEGYFVVNKQTGKKMSRRPLTRARAQAQLQALYANVHDYKEVTLKRIGRRTDVSKSGVKAGVRKYGNVEFADPVNKKYPIDTPGHIKAAWSYIHMPKNARKYVEKGGLGAVQNAIAAAYERQFGHKPNAKKISGRKLKESETEKSVKFGRRYRRGAWGNMRGLAKHLAHKYGGDPHFFTKVFNSEELQRVVQYRGRPYTRQQKARIAALAHKYVTGIWPGEHRGKNPSGPG